MKAGTSHRLRGIAAAALLLVTSVAFAATGAPRAIAPPDQAVLDAYAAWASDVRSAGDIGQATAIEARAGKLRAACDSTTSVFLGFDPHQELTGYAESLARSRRLDAARKIEAAAREYRGDQVLRLSLQGGRTLDPARYMGRPEGYEGKRAQAESIEERIVTDAFSASPPRGGGWKLVTKGRMPIVYWKDPVWMTREAVKGQSFVLIITLLSPGAAVQGSAADFHRTVAERIRATTRGRFRLLHVATGHRGAAEAPCADFETIVEERDNPSLPGMVLVSTDHGFECLDAASKYVVQAYYSERRPQGAPSVLDDTLRAEAEEFLRNVSVNPRRETDPGGTGAAPLR